ncbi:hypothetical protein AW736_24170 [Termitidicoccus mucosus]|uniref:Uncharacterized protein n=1 Tax=Termitidicoccus mucosus TaxID=1184151 RepID=A0A178IAY6_9BACT|nr:hypothetical protein AW736_24170 [Opitutaceae bacterium TSB47]
MQLPSVPLFRIPMIKSEIADAEGSSHSDHSYQQQVQILPVIHAITHEPAATHQLCLRIVTAMATATRRTDNDKNNAGTP